ncbi:hypothetical protein FHS85_000023 [Rhodoligotrophos appendicifer]|uniref:hypothetical protein n=1 Tax=Rhodoligotrophos appendicifer TaxID=987056 RepID=UPI00117D1B11|nr:hypothetical protein [Rhodoligotrophos appendicifer]
MTRLIVSLGISAAMLISGTAFSFASKVDDNPRASIIQAGDFAELTRKWCSANPDVEHILVLPAAMFVDSEQLTCDSGPYKLYRLIEHDDPDDFEYFLDPPFGNKTRLGCDGKAGRAMKTVALNCRPLHPVP